MLYILWHCTSELTSQVGYRQIGFYLSPIFLGDEGLLLSQVYATTLNNSPISTVILDIPGYVANNNKTVLDIKIQINTVFAKFSHFGSYIISE